MSHTYRRHERPTRASWAESTARRQRGRVVVTLRAVEATLDAIARAPRVPAEVRALASSHRGDLVAAAQMLTHQGTEGGR